MNKIRIHNWLSVIDQRKNKNKLLSLPEKISPQSQPTRVDQILFVASKCQICNCPHLILKIAVSHQDHKLRHTDSTLQRNNSNTWRNIKECLPATACFNLSTPLKLESIRKKIGSVQPAPRLLNLMKCLDFRGLNRSAANKGCLIG
jgi:hypothetical protein